MREGILRVIGLSTRSFRQPLAELDEIDFAALLRPVVERPEPRIRLGHHVEREPGAVAFAVAVPVLELVLAHALDRLRQAVGHRVEQFRGEVVDGGIEQREIDRAALHQGLRFIARRAALRLAHDDAAEFVDHFVGHDQRIRDPLVINAKGRNDLRESAEPVELVCAPGLTKCGAVHRALDADEKREKVGAPAVRRGAVFRAGLAEQCEVARDGEIAGHSDFLSAADPQAVDAADHRLVALQDGRDHVVEQPHVLPVLAGMTGVDLGVLSRVAAGAERGGAGAGEDDRDGGPVVRRLANGQDDLLDHVARVAVHLPRVIERDPDAVQPVDRQSGVVENRMSRDEDLARGKVVGEVVILHPRLPPEGGENVGRPAHKRV